MHRHYLIHAVFAIAAILIPLTAQAFCRLRDIVMTPLRMVSAETFRLVIDLPALVTFKLIGLLKPEYRESYRSHGLNFHLTA